MTVPIEQAAVQEFAAQAINVESGQIVDLLSHTLQPLIGKLSLMVGGIFGLYLIFIISRLYYEHKKVQILRDIRFDLDNLNVHYDVRSSKEKKGLLRRIYRSIEGLFHQKSLKRHYSKKK